MNVVAMAQLGKGLIVPPMMGSYFLSNDNSNPVIFAEK